MNRHRTAAVLAGLAVMAAPLFSSFVGAQSTQVPVRGTYANVIEQTVDTAAPTYFHKSQSGATTTATDGETVRNIKFIHRGSGGTNVVLILSTAAPNGSSVYLYIPVGATIELNGVPIQGYYTTTISTAGPLTIWGWN